MNKLSSRINLPITAISTALVILIALVVFIYPQQTTDMADLAFNWILYNLDTLFLTGTFIAVIFLSYLMFSKYGNIKLGNEKPEFSKFKIFNMLFCASFGSSALFWCFAEVMYYYNDPPFGIEAHSVAAAEYGLAYNFFHWGPSAWALYAICAVPIIYSFYIKGEKQFRLSAVCATVYEEKWPKQLTKVIDALFIFSCFGVCSISLGLSVPLISECVSAVIGIPAGFTMNLVIILIISVVFTMSSYVGLGKGMSKLSDINVVIFICFLIALFLLGKTVFTLEYVSTAIGIMVTEYVHMSFWTDPIGQGGFPQIWTVFYWAYWLTFGPGMGVFIARISNGHRLRDIIVMVLVAGPVGSFIMHGITQSYTMSLNLAGTVDAAGMVAAGQGNAMIVEILKSTPIPIIGLAAFIIVSILFMATTLDSNSFTLASVATKKLSDSNNPSPFFRLYWCLLLAVIPLLLILINAELNTLKTIALVVATPLGVLMVLLNVKSFQTMKLRFQGMNSAEIAAFSPERSDEEKGSE